MIYTILLQIPFSLNLGAFGSKFLFIPRQLYRWTRHSLTHSLADWLNHYHCWETLPEIDPRDLFKKIQRSIYPFNTIHPLIAPLCYISLMSFEYITNTISIVQYPTNAMPHISSWLQGWRMDGMGRMLCDLWWWKQEENKGGRPTTRERRKCVPKSSGNRPLQYDKMPRCSLTIWTFDFNQLNIKHHPPGVW